MDLGPHPWRFKPGDREHAPGSLRTVQALVNTINHGVDDSLDRDGTLELLARRVRAAGRAGGRSPVRRSRAPRKFARRCARCSGTTASSRRTRPPRRRRWSGPRTAQLTIAFGGGRRSWCRSIPGCDGLRGPWWWRIAIVERLRLGQGLRRCGWLLRPFARSLELVVLMKLLRKPTERARTARQRWRGPAVRGTRSATSCSI